MCAPEILALDRNAEALWAKLLRRSKIVLDQKGQVLDLNGRRAAVIRGFAIPDLQARLEAQAKREAAGPQDDLARARIWWHVAEAAAPGDSIPEMSEASAYQLNPFIVPAELRFPFPLRDRDRLAAELAELTEPSRRCENPHCRKGPRHSRASLRGKSARARFCDRACRAHANRGYSEARPRKVALTV